MKRSVFNLVSALFFLALQIPTSIAASFDCTKAGTQVEKLICSTAVLGELDVALSTNYKNIRASNIGDSAGADLLQTQREWMRQRNTCSSADCIERIYRKRLDEICSYPVLSGIHPPCKYSAEIGNKPTANNQPNESISPIATPQPSTSTTQATSPSTNRSALARNNITNQLIGELNLNNNTEKFWHLGVCFATMIEGMLVIKDHFTSTITLEPYMNEVRKIAALIDIDTVKNKAFFIANESCPNMTPACAKSKIPKNTTSFSAGYFTAVKSVQKGSATPDFVPLHLHQVLDHNCKKYINY